MARSTIPSLPTPSHTLKYLQGYPPAIIQQVQTLIEQGRLSDYLQKRYDAQHSIQTDTALFGYVTELKNRHMRNAPQLSKIHYDSKLKDLSRALGTHTTIARVQGVKLKTKHEIRIASLFKTAPAEFLSMIVVHELAHLKEKEHNKAFYQLCTHMEPSYHQYEFDLRLYLTAQELEVSAAVP